MRIQNKPGPIERVDLTWYCLRVPPQKERTAARILQGMNYVAVTPVEQRLRRRNKHDKERTLMQYAVMPGYVFLALAEPNHLWRVLNFHFVNSVVAVNGAPAVFDNAKLETFLRLEPETMPSYYRYMRTRREFDIGDEVYVLKGPFKGAKVTVEDIDGREATFLVNLLGANRPISISVDDCEKAA